MRLGFLAVALVPILCGAALPGAMVFTNPQFVDFLKTLVIEQVNLYLRGLRLPDVTGDQDGLTFSFEDIGFVTFNAPPEDADLTIVPDVGVSITLNNVYYVVVMGYSFTKDSWPHFGASGIGMLVCNRTAITLKLAINATNSTLNLRVLSASSNVGYSALDGFPSELTITAQQVEEEMNKQLTVVVDSSFNTWLQNEMYHIPAIAGLEIDFHPTAAPDFESSGIWYYGRGAFFPVNDAHFLPPFHPDLNRSSTPLNSDNFQIFLGNYVFDSFFWQFWAAGKLSKTIYNDDIPAEVPYNLNTTNWADFVPPLALHWPDHFMYVDVSFLASPTVKITPSEVNVSGSVNATFVVITEPLNVTAFSANITFYASLNMTMSNTSVFFNVLNANVTSVSLMANYIGPWSTYNLLVLLDFGVLLGRSEINKILGLGIALPALASYWTFDNITIALFEGYLAVTVETAFVPPVEPYIRCSDGSTCGYLNTCCGAAKPEHDYCCPTPAATCCPGGQLCCPHAYVCVNGNTECQPIAGAQRTIPAYDGL